MIYIYMGVKCRSIVIVRYQQEEDNALEELFAIGTLGVPYISDQEISL